MYLRSYAKPDFEAIYALDQVCFTARFRFSRAMMRRVVTAPGALVLLACERDELGAETLLGFCAVEGDRTTGSAYISTLDVAPENRRRGVARSLLLAVHAALQDIGIRVVWLHVSVENSAAVQLYEALGYQQRERAQGFYGAGFDAWVYSKELG